MSLSQKVPPCLKEILLARNQVKDWSIYPFNVPAISKLRGLKITQKVCFFVGENGTGKSTLLEATAEHCGYSKEGGSQNYIYKDNINQANAACKLSDYLTLSWTQKIKKGFFLRAESFFNVATYLDSLQKDDPVTLSAYGGKSLHQQSHGESFLSLIQNRFSDSGFYLLDEPEAALSPQRQLSLLVVLNKLLLNDNTQFIISTHSPIIMAYPHAQIFNFSSSGITEIEYKDTEAYKITSDFLINPESYLHHLFDESESIS